MRSFASLWLRPAAGHGRGARRRRLGPFPGAPQPSTGSNAKAEPNASTPAPLGIDRVLGFEQHFIRGKAKMETRVTLAFVVLPAMALGRIRTNQRS